MTFVGLQGAYICEGMFSHGVADGYARWIWDDGTIYQGQIENGYPHGRGQMICGKMYKDVVQNGQWERGKFDHGKIFHEDANTRNASRDVQSLFLNKFKNINKGLQANKDRMALFKSLKSTE